MLNIAYLFIAFFVGSYCGFSFMKNIYTEDIKELTDYITELKNKQDERRN